MSDLTIHDHAANGTSSPEESFEPRPYDLIAHSHSAPAPPVIHSLTELCELERPRTPSEEDIREALEVVPQLINRGYISDDEGHLLMTYVIAAGTSMWIRSVLEDSQPRRRRGRKARGHLRLFGSGTPSPQP